MILMLRTSAMSADERDNSFAAACIIFDPKFTGLAILPASIGDLMIDSGWTGASGAADDLSEAQMGSWSLSRGAVDSFTILV